MTQANVLDRADAVRRQTLTILTSLRERGKAFSLPEPPATLEQLERKLEDNTYQVLVVGEAKRGKSTFVNALIGRDILPTDVDIATSQVFRVCPAEREAYRLRFEDDSQQAITAADLPRYGSQVMADAVGVPRLDQIIRWIEVDGPIQFLPPNVRILDTPGLGALYAAHAEITYRFVPHADAVIFVLDSQTPIGEPEIKFVEKLLEVTNNILFIQTKIDLFRKEAWQEIQKRNQDILGQRFKGRLPDARVWPISSTNLRNAAETGDDDYLIVSRHKELATGLQAFLFRVAGWSRAATAILVAEHSQKLSRTILTARLDNLVDESKQKRAETQQRAVERRKHFEADWGAQGQKRRELVQNLQRATSLGKQRMMQLFHARGELEIVYLAEVEKLDSIAKVNQVGQALAFQVAEAALDHWRMVQQNANAQCAEAMTPFAISLDLVSGDDLRDSPHTTLSPVEMRPADKLDGWFGKVRSAVGYQAAGSTVAVGWASVFVTVGLVTWPVAIPVVTLAGIASWYIGWQSAEKAQLKAVKQELAKHLSNRLRQLQKYFFDVDQTSSRFSMVDEHFSSLERILTEQLAKLATQKLAEAQGEINRLTESANLDDQQRRAKAEEVGRQLADWDGIGQTIKAIQGELRELDRSAAQASQA